MAKKTAAKSKGKVPVKKTAVKAAPAKKSAPVKKAKAAKYVYFFGGGKADGDRTMKDLLGGKGSGLAEMTNAGLPVPPGFTITTAACNLYYELGREGAGRGRAEMEDEPAEAREGRPASSSARRTTRCSSRSARARSSRCRA